MPLSWDYSTCHRRWKLWVLKMASWVSNPTIYRHCIMSESRRLPRLDIGSSQRGSPMIPYTQRAVSLWARISQAPKRPVLGSRDASQIPIATPFAPCAISLASTPATEICVEIWQQWAIFSAIRKRQGFCCGAWQQIATGTSFILQRLRLSPLSANRGSPASVFVNCWVLKTGFTMKHSLLAVHFTQSALQG